LKKPTDERLLKESICGTYSICGGKMIRRISPQIEETHRWKIA